jgi:hypothetical protein
MASRLWAASEERREPMTGVARCLWASPAGCLTTIELSRGKCGANSRICYLRGDMAHRAWVCDTSPIIAEQKPLPTEEDLAKDLRKVLSNGVHQPLRSSATAETLEDVAKEIVDDPTLQTYALVGSAIERAINQMGDRSFTQSLRALFRIGDWSHLPKLADRRHDAARIRGRDNLEDSDLLRMCTEVARVMLILAREYRRTLVEKGTIKPYVLPATASATKTRLTSPELLSYHALVLQYSALSLLFADYFSRRFGGYDQPTIYFPSRGAFGSQGATRDRSARHLFDAFLGFREFCKPSREPFDWQRDLLTLADIKKLRFLWETAVACAPAQVMQLDRSDAYLYLIGLDSGEQRVHGLSVQDTYRYHWKHWVHNDRLSLRDHPEVKPTSIELLSAKAAALESVVRNAVTYVHRLELVARRMATRWTLGLFAAEEWEARFDGLSIKNHIDNYFSTASDKLDAVGVAWFDSRTVLVVDSNSSPQYE